MIRSRYSLVSLFVFLTLTTAAAGGIFFGLIGDREEAQKWLKSVKKRKPQYPGIKDALKALEE